MRTMHVDLESYSDVDIKKAGLYKYVQSPAFEILLFSYAFDDDPVVCIDLTESQLPSLIVNALQDPNIIKKAQNAAFEYYCLNKFYYSPLSQWQCSMVHALYCGFPAKLSDQGTALGLSEAKRKMSVGMSLIRTFCIPCKATKNNGFRTRTLPKHEPEKWQLFKDYNIRDVETERDISKMLSPFQVPDSEWELWRTDIEINCRGVKVDALLASQAISISQNAAEELINEAKTLSGIDNPRSVKQLTDWLNEEINGEIDNLQKATVKTLISKLEGTKAKRMLEIRQELGKTSVKKYDAILNAVCADGRVRGLLQFYGANRTGRWAGRLVQVQNLPQNHLHALGLARQLVLQGKSETLKLIYGSLSDTLSQLIRTAFIPDNGHIFAVSDFSAIEARVIAWYAEERWRQDVFTTHGKIYEASASAMFGVPIELISKGNPEYELRQKGKIAELALGYQGATGALIQMGALNKGLKEEELPEIVSRWRRANPRIVDFWYQLENAAFKAMKEGIAGAPKGLIFRLEARNGLSFLTIQLPIGRKLYYAKPFIRTNELGREALYYWGVENGKWGEISTYGGKLTENIVQATARDCLAEAILKLQRRYRTVVMHIHDEVVLEVVDPESLEDINGVLAEPLSWAQGLTLKGDGFTSEYYKKD